MDPEQDYYAGWKKHTKTANKMSALHSLTEIEIAGNKWKILMK